MKRLLALALVATALYVGIDEMADLTQNRPDHVTADSSTRVVFDVATRRAPASEPQAVEALWAVCSLTVSSAIVDGPLPVAEGYAVTVRPALGEHGRRRLTGCLEDATIDRVLGDVVEVVTLPPDPAR